ncbi:MAG: ABC transporter permease [Dokdonella sp.]|uniref:ABC transporter permease n=1 Tax=Dokdonella sp. TaxID=2291710 RepID=UPI003F81405F
MSALPLPLILRFARRELANRFAGSLSGALWTLFQPLLQLAVYAFVFVHVFKARIPGADAPGYVPFLVTALWPWTAFSEAILRSTTAIQDNAALIGKVALPREVLVVAVAGTSFVVHAMGFCAILLVMRLAGQPVNLWLLAPALALYLPLFALALGIAFACAAIQVFVRDLVQLLGQILPLLMFGAPIFYDRASLPAGVQGLLDLNPFTYYADAFRALLLGHGSLDWAHLGIMLVVAVAALAFGRWLFHRLDPHFEDFL